MVVFAAVLLALALIGPPTAAQAAPATVSTTAQGLRTDLTLLGLPVNLLTTTQSTWQTGQAANTQQVANIGVPNVLGTGAITARTGPDSTSNGGTARATVAGLNVLGASTLGLDAVDTSCTMSPTAVTADTDVANLKLLGATVNPSTGLNLDVPGILTGVLDRQTASYNATTGRLSYTVQGLNLDLLGGTTGALAKGTVIVAESTCSGYVKFGSIGTSAKTVVPGTTGTPTVTITNAGEVAAPNTVVTIPAPPTGYTLGEVTATGGGTCSTASTTQIRCTGVTVPGGGSVTVSLPVTVAANAAGAANWSPADGSITAVSTPFPAVPDTTISVRGEGRLVTVGNPQTTRSTITVTQMALPAGKSASTPITVTNEGPSDATTTVTVPLAGRPDGVSITRAVVGSNLCTVTSTAITCTGVTVPANDKIAITVTAAATTTTPPGTTWDVSNITATLNGFAATGAGRLLTVSDPDVNLNNGLTIVPVTATPGSQQAANVRIRVTNAGLQNGTGTLTIPAPPAGYTVGTVTTTGGGTCTNGAMSIYCENVTFPRQGTTTVTVPVTLDPDVTANWVTTPTRPVSATSGDSTGQTTGTLVTADPRWTYSVDAVPPAPRTVRPGQSTTMSVTITNDGPSDAGESTFTVLAPRSTTFGPLTGPASQQCTVTGPTALRCTVTLAAGDDVTYTLPLNVSAQADASTPLDGGCVSFNNDADCDDPDDSPLPGIQLRTPLANRLTETLVAATITPGTTGVARVRLRSTQDEDDLTVTIPLGALPGGWTATAPGCAVTTSVVTCTGVDLQSNEQRDLTLTVAVPSSATPPAKWTAADVVVTDGDEEISRDGDLAIAGPPVTDLTATVTGPADNTVLPGGTTQITVVVANGGPSDATDASVVVIAPNSTTFGPPASPCQLSSPRRAVCTVDVVAEDETPELRLPLVVAAGADPFTPLGGGCVELDGVSGCGPDDEPIEPIVLQVPFDRRVTLDATQATVTPGRQDVATVTVTAAHGDLDDIAVSVPLNGVPGGLSVRTQSATNGGVCTATATRVTCTGLTIPDGTTATVSLGVAAAPSAVQGTPWSADPVTVSRGTQSVAARERLAVVGAPVYTLDVNTTPPSGPVPPGGTGTLTVSVDNTGPSDANDETISVLAPDGGTFGPLGGPTAQFCRIVTSGRVSCTFDLPVDAPAINFALPVVVSGGADPAQPLGGGCVDLDDNGLCGPGDDPLPPIVLAAPFDRQLDISTSPARVTPGTTGNAVVLLSASPAQTGLTLSIPLDDKPAEMTLGTVTATPAASCAVNATAITCTNVSVPASGTTITIPVSVASGVQGTLVWSTRAITATNPAGDQATGAGLLVRTGDPDYTLDAQVTGPAPGTVLPGDTTTMRVTLTNAGPSTATDALVTLRAPVGTAFGTLAAPLADSCTRASATRISCSVTLGVAPASLVWDVPIVVPGNADPNQALTGGCLDLDGDAACGGPSDRALPDIRLATPLGRIATVTATNTPVVPGRTAVTTVSVALSQARTGVRVTIPRDALPAGLTTTAIAADGATCTTSGTAYSCGDFAVTAGGTVALRVTVAASAAADPGAVWAPAVAVTRGDESVTRTVAAATVADADAPLTVTVVGPAPGTVTPGSAADLAITATNPGPSDARNAFLSFRAPGGTTFDPGFALPRYCTRASGTRVDCTLDVVAAGTNRQWTLRVLVPGTADPDEPVDGGCVDTNRDNVCTSPPDNPLPDIVLGAELDGTLGVGTRSGTATPGLTGTGYVVVTASRAVTGLTVTVPLAQLPAGFTVSSATGPTGSACQIQAAQVLCTGVDLVAGTNQAVALGVTTASSLAAGVTWTPTGITVSRGTGDTAQGNGTIVLTGPPVPGVRIVLTGPTDPVPLGTTTVVTATITNTGPSDATGTTTTVTAPSQTTFGTLSGQAAIDCTPATSTQLTCRFNQAVGAAARIWQLPVVVPADADPSLPATGGCVAVNGSSTCLTTFELADEQALYQPLRNTVTIDTTPVEIAPGSDGQPQITITDTSTRDGLSLVVPLETLPDGFAVSAAASESSSGEASNGTCAVTTAQVRCTDMAEEEGTVTITLTVAVDDAVSADAKWTATNITLTDDSSATDQLVASGVLVTTGGDTDTVTTTFGTPTVNPAAPGQKTVLPIRLRNPGPNAANPHVMTLKVPSGLTPGSPLPADCVWDEESNVVTCTRNLAVGAAYTYNIPFVVGRTVSVGTVITGGCLDAEPANGSCSDAEDQAMPAISVVSSRVDLELGVKRKTTTARPGGTVLLKLPYSNNGSQTAAGITFSIDPPAGVNLALARVLLDASGDDAGLVTIECMPDETGDANAVVCDGPDAPVGATSELWLSMRITSAAKKGVHPVRVTISTTSAEGNVVNNTIEALLSIAGSSDSTPTDTSNSGGGGGDNLPKTGQNLLGLLVLSMLLVIGGVMLRVGGRTRKQ